MEDFAEDAGDELEEDYDSSEGEDLMDNLLEMAKALQDGKANSLAPVGGLAPRSPLDFPKGKTYLQLKGAACPMLTPCQDTNTGSCCGLAPASVAKHRMGSLIGLANLFTKRKMCPQA